MSSPVKIQDTAQFRGLWDSGLIASEIAKILGVGASSVSGAARRYGYPSRHNKLSSPDREMFFNLYCSSISQAEMARAYKCDVKTVRRIARDFGLPDRSTARSLGAEVCLASADRKKIRALSLADAPKRRRLKAPAATAAPTVSGDLSRWSHETDEQVLGAGGKYMAIAELSKTLGRSSTQIMARWHLLRCKR